MTSRTPSHHGNPSGQVEPRSDAARAGLFLVCALVVVLALATTEEPGTRFGTLLGISRILTYVMLAALAILYAYKLARSLRRPVSGPAEAGVSTAAPTDQGLSLGAQQSIGSHVVSDLTSHAGRRPDDVAILLKRMLAE